VVAGAGRPHFRRELLEHFLRVLDASAAPSLARARVTCAGGLMQHSTPIDRAGSWVPKFLAFPWGGTAPASRSLPSLLACRGACARSVVNSLSLLLPDFYRVIASQLPEKRPRLQGSRFADSPTSTIHRQFSAPRRRPSRVISTPDRLPWRTSSAASMTGCCAFSGMSTLHRVHISQRRAGMPDAPSDNSAPSISSFEKSKTVYHDNPSWRLTGLTPTGRPRWTSP
jgi:hypothetical protein